MRLLQVVPFFANRFGGQVSVVRAISKKLSEKNEVDVYTTSAIDGKRDSSSTPFVSREDGYRVFYFPRIFKFSKLNVSPAMGRALGANISDCDLVHLHSWRQFQDLAADFFARRTGVPYVIQPHGSMPRLMDWRIAKSFYDSLFGRRIIDDASKAIALSSMEAEQFRSFGMSETKIEIVPNGIDLAEYVDLPKPGLFRAKRAISDEARILLYVGRIHKIKGLDVLIPAFAEVAKKARNTLLVICGPDDGYVQALLSLIRNQGLEGRVYYAGPLYGREKHEAYVDADLVVLPSWYETFPMTVLEAYACFKPVVVSDLGGLRDMVRDGLTGSLVEPGNVHALAEACLELIGDSKLAKRMGVMGRALAQEKFSLSKVVQTLSTLYATILEDSTFAFSSSPRLIAHA